MRPFGFKKHLKDEKEMNCKLQEELEGTQKQIKEEKERSEIYVP